MSQGFQCCPMDTYDTDSAGVLRPVCTCGDGCDCMCRDCFCAEWGEEYEDNDREPWLSPNGYACVQGCPDDVCRSAGTCAWPSVVRVANTPAGGKDDEM